MREVFLFEGVVKAQVIEDVVDLLILYKSRNGRVKIVIKEVVEK